jgi:hypothetical protein
VRRLAHDDPMPRFPLSHDSRGLHLLLSPAEAPAVVRALSAGGVRFHEDDGGGAGCAGPETVVLRFEDGPELREAVRAALEEGPDPRTAP